MKGAGCKVQGTRCRVKKAKAPAFAEATAGKEAKNNCKLVN
jgi:hypothetical protein